MSAESSLVEYDSTCALVVVDVQNDFADPAGALSVRGGEQVVPNVNREIARARSSGALVVYTQDWHPPRTPHFAIDGGIWPVHCVQDTWGARLHPGLTIDGSIVRKGASGEDGYSGFTMRDPIAGSTIPTALDGILRGRAVSRVVVCGLATDYCVKATALDAAALGYRTLVLADAIRAVDLEPGDGERAIEAMASAGVTVVGLAAA